MHEMSLMMGVMDAVMATASQAGATRVRSITLQIGVMSEVIEDALRFSFEALSEGTVCADAALRIEAVEPSSVCLECGASFSHDRFHRTCPACGSVSTKLVTGREMRIASIEVDLPDDDSPASASCDGDSAADGFPASSKRDGELTDGALPAKATPAPASASAPADRKDDSCR